MIYFLVSELFCVGVVVLTLMKGDEGIEAGERRTDFFLFPDTRHDKICF